MTDDPTIVGPPVEPPGGTPPGEPPLPPPGAPPPAAAPNWPMRILIGLVAAIVVLLVVIVGALLFGGGDEEPVAATSTTTTLPPTTLPATTTAPTTSTSTTTTLPETTTTAETTTTTSTTTSTTTTTMATTTTAGPCAFAEDLQGPIDNFVFLDPDGIGSFTEFGDAAEDVIRVLTCLLGDPDEDSGWTGSFSVYGTCPGTEVRGVRWGPLTAIFGDAMLFGTEAREFYSWRYSDIEFPDDLGLMFPETQLGLGTTVAELQRAYGDDVDIFEDDLSGAEAFLIGTRSVGDIDIPLIFGTLSEDGLVQFIDSGFFCGE